VVQASAHTTSTRRSDDREARRQARAEKLTAYVLEAYKPAAQRRCDYYVLAQLSHGTLIGRADLRATATRSPSSPPIPNSQPTEAFAEALENAVGSPINYATGLAATTDAYRLTASEDFLGRRSVCLNRPHRGCRWEALCCR
jgi:hypothetical protein